MLAAPVGVQVTPAALKKAGKVNYDRPAISALPAE